VFTEIILDARRDERIFLEILPGAGPVDPVAAPYSKA
jgi:hypothetical protein